jgi:hypothetical protein
MPLNPASFTTPGPSNPALPMPQHNNNSPAC